MVGRQRETIKKKSLLFEEIKMDKLLDKLARQREN